VRLTPVVIVVLASLGVPLSAQAIPLLYTFEATVHNVTLDGPYTGSPMRVGDFVSYTYLVDYDDVLPNSNDRIARFSAQLLSMDMGHGITRVPSTGFAEGLSYLNPSLGCSSNGCGQLNAGGVRVLSGEPFTNWFLDGAMAASIVIDDQFISDSGIFNAVVTRVGVTPAHVPEPSTLLLMGLGGLWFARRRKPAV